MQRSSCSQCAYDASWSNTCLARCNFDIMLATRIKKFGSRRYSLSADRVDASAERRVIGRSIAPTLTNKSLSLFFCLISSCFWPFLWISAFFTLRFFFNVPFMKRNCWIWWLHLFRSHSTGSFGADTPHSPTKAAITATADFRLSNMLVDARRRWYFNLFYFWSVWAVQHPSSTLWSWKLEK